MNTFAVESNGEVKAVPNQWPHDALAQQQHGFLHSHSTDLFHKQTAEQAQPMQNQLPEGAMKPQDTVTASTRDADVPTPLPRHQRLNLLQPPNQDLQYSPATVDVQAEHNVSAASPSSIVYSTRVIDFSTSSVDDPKSPQQSSQAVLNHTNYLPSNYSPPYGLESAPPNSPTFPTSTQQEEQRIHSQQQQQQQQQLQQQQQQQQQQLQFQQQNQSQQPLLQHQLQRLHQPQHHHDQHHHDHHQSNPPVTRLQQPNSPSYEPIHLQQTGTQLRKTRVEASSHSNRHYADDFEEYKPRKSRGLCSFIPSEKRQRIVLSRDRKRICVCLTVCMSEICAVKMCGCVHCEQLCRHGS